MQDFIANQREQIAELCRTHHVKRLAVFGSAVRDDFDATRSDVDVLVEFETMPIEIYSDNKWSLHDALMALLGRKIDLLTWKNIRNPYFLKEVENSHEMLYAA